MFISGVLTPFPHLFSVGVIAEGPTYCQKQTQFYESNVLN